MLDYNYRCIQTISGREYKFGCAPRRNEIIEIQILGALVLSRPIVTRDVGHIEGIDIQVPEMNLTRDLDGSSAMTCSKSKSK